MPSPPVRTLRQPLIWAKRSPALFTKARGHNPYARAGLAFQRKVGKALAATAKQANGTLEVEPWFTFRDANGDGACSPDFVLHACGCVIVIEVKLKYVLGAEAKLKGLYVPVLAQVCGLPKERIRPLVITKILTPDAAGLAIEAVMPALYLANALRAPVLHWLGQGRILWEPPGTTALDIAI